MRYGSYFCDTVIKDGIVSKKSKNDEGQKKLECEYSFYKHQCSLLMPRVKCVIDDIGGTELQIQYLRDSHTLYDIFKESSVSKRYFLYDKVILSLNLLHASTQRENVCDEASIYEELITKIRYRYKTIKSIISRYEKDIKSVNGVSIKGIDECLSGIEEWYNTNIKGKNMRSARIHGDPTLNNILVKNNEGKEVYFIDPKGYFGTYDNHFGIPEYDIAKVHFSLSGYSQFDSISDIENHVKISGNDISIDLQPLLPMDFVFKNKLVSFIMVTIWLGNAYGFRNNKLKCVSSFYYAMYMYSLFCLEK
jgi:hypothetical protein